MELKKTLLVALATTLALGSCTDFTNGFDEKAHYYQENFVKQFGEIDPNQDWNMATRANVTVSVSNESNVQIFALNGGTYKLVGDYSKVNGSQTLGVDVLKGTEKLLVTDGFTSQITTIGGSVSFGLGTRVATYGSYTDGSGNTMTISETSVYKEFTEAEVKKWDQILPEIAESGSNGLTKIVEKQLDNLKNVTADCSFISNGPFYIYPLYYRTGAQDVVGVYVEEPAEITNVTTKIPSTQALDGKDHYVCKADFYTIKSGSELQYGKWVWEEITDPNALENQYGYDFGAAGLTKIDELRPEYAGEKTFHPATHYYNETTKEWVLNTKASHTVIGWFDVENATSSEDHFLPNYGGAAKMRSRAIKIDIPVGQRFGFYIVNGNTFYSQSNLNPDKAYKFGYDNDGKISYNKTTQVDNARACHVSTFELEGKTYLGFEDWSNSLVTGGELYSDEDLNDVMFLIDGATPTPLNEDPTAAAWVLACEDLGGSFDGDYNDVVFAVDHISGRSYANVTPLAAGGTLASYLYYGDRQLGEIHQLLGGGAQTSGAYTPINVGASRGSAGQQLRVNVPADFSMAYCETGSTDFNESSASNMGGFSVQVAPEGSTGNSQLGSGSVIAAPELGAVPAIFCIPATYTVENYPETGKKTEYYWAWAQELNSLVEIGDGEYGPGAYPDFAGWVANHAENTDWYKHPNPNGKIVSELTMVSNMSGSGNLPEESQDIVCSVSDVEETTIWGSIKIWGQIITLPEGVEVGNKLLVANKNSTNTDFRLYSYDGTQITGNTVKEFKIELTQDCINAGKIYVAFYSENSIVSAKIVNE